MATLLVFIYISKITGITFIKSMILSWEKEKLEKVKVLRGNFGESFDYEKFYCKCSIFLFINYFFKNCLNIYYLR